MHRGCGAGQVVYLVDLQLDGIRDVMPNELKILPAHEVGDVLLRPCEQVIQAEDMVPTLHLQPFT